MRDSLSGLVKFYSSFSYDGQQIFQNNILKRRALSFFIALLTFLNGCAINPYVDDVTQTTQDFSNYDPKDLLLPNLQYALQTANNLYNAYEEKLRASFNREQNLAAGIIGTAASVLGLAAYGAHTDAITGVAIGGGAAYQLGTWNTSRDRLDIYQEGKKALSCAYVASAPLQFTIRELESLKTLNMNVITKIEAVSEAAGDVTTGIVLAKIKIPLSVQGELITTAETTLAKTSNELKTANDLLKNSNTLARRANNLGAVLMGKVKEIRTQVNGALKGTLANLNSLRNVVESLSNYVNLFGPGLNLSDTLNTALQPTRDTTNTSENEVNAEYLLDPKGSSIIKGTEYTAADAQLHLAKALGDLDEKRSNLAAAIASLDGAVRPAALDEITTRLEDCVDPNNLNLASGIQLDRSEVTFQPGVASRKYVTITGGTAPFKVELMDDPTPGIKTRVPTASHEVNIFAETDTKAGALYSAKVSDSADPPHTQTLIIRIAGTATTAPPKVQQETNKCKGKNDKLSKEQVCLIQHVVGVKEDDGGIDGNLGEKTCKKIESWLAGKNIPQPFNGTVSNYILNLIKRDKKNDEDFGCPDPDQASPATTECEKDRPILDQRQCKIENAKTLLECELPKQELVMIQEQLQFASGALQANGEFDDETRAAIKKFRKLKNIKESDVLDCELLDALEEHKSDQT